MLRKAYLHGRIQTSQGDTVTDVYHQFILGKG